MKIKTISSALLLLLALSLSAYGQLTWPNASNIWNNFNTAYYQSFTYDGLNYGYYNWSQSSGFSGNDRWQNAEMIEMATDCYIAAPTTQNENTLTTLLNGFDLIYGTDWTSDQYNDDIMWAVLAHARAYLAISNATKTVTPSMTSWAVTASNNFCWVYNGGHSPNRVNPQYDNTFGGGMWWTNNSNPTTATKNSCVNGPGALAAFYLYLIYPNAGFQAKGTNMINWETTYLVNSGNGFVYDHYDAGGVVGIDISYNAGTYVGAAGFLGVGIPETGSEYYTNNDCPNAILPNWGTGGQNNDGFNGIFLRWVGTYEILSGNTNWEGFFNNQASKAWAVTNSAGLSWDDWLANTPASGLYSWDCSPSVVALQWVQISQSATAPLAPLPEMLTMTMTNGQPQLSWLYGTLQTSTVLAGPYHNLSGASSPYTVTTINRQRYYRVLEN